MTNKIFFIANNHIGDWGLSGGDRIFIELARNWKKNADLTFIGTEEAITVSKREGLFDITYLKTSDSLGFTKDNVFTLRSILKNFIIKLFRGVSFVFRNKRLFQGLPLIYSVSDFYPDSIPAFIIKIFNRRSIWIAGFFLFAPAPWQKDSPYKGRDFFRGFLYWLSQRLAYWMIKRYADLVFVTSEPDVIKFVTKNRPASKIIVIKGGVDLRPSSDYLSSSYMIFSKNKIYSACFVGRFHPQKGVLALIDIWKEVVRKVPGAKLAMIGNGPLEDEVRKKIEENGLSNNIVLFGFLDGEDKFKIFKQSKIVVHPATFDSGGMAAAEAMAWGLPAVGFDLEALKTYYSRGMDKAPIGDYLAFANAILKLLNNNEYYVQKGKEARDYIVQEWDWNKRAHEILNKMELLGLTK